MYDQSDVALRAFDGPKNEVIPLKHHITWPLIALPSFVRGGLLAIVTSFTGSHFTATLTPFSVPPKCALS